MDLYEYQARDIFEKHGVPVLRGITADHPGRGPGGRGASWAPPVVVVKAQVKTGGRGKAGGVKVAKSPEEAEPRAAEILGLDIKGHVVKTVMIAEGADIAEEYYFSLLLDRANRRYLAMCSKEGGMDIETLAVERPEALARVPVDPNVGIDQAKADEIVADGRVRGRRRRRDRPGAAAARQGVRGRGRHAGRGQPAGQDRRRQDRRARRQGLAGRERRLPAPRPRGAGGQVGGGPAGGGGQGQGPQLRQARRQRRHHRQRRGPGDEHPGRGGVRGRGVRRRRRSRPTSSTSAAARVPR